MRYTLYARARKGCTPGLEHPFPVPLGVYDVHLVRLSFARAKKLARAAECLVHSLTPSGFWAENHPKNRGFVGILRGQKCLKRRFSRRSPVGEWSCGARSMPRVFGRGSRSQPAALVIALGRS